MSSIKISMFILIINILIIKLIYNQEEKEEATTKQRFKS